MGFFLRTAIVNTAREFLLQCQNVFRSGGIVGFRFVKFVDVDGRGGAIVVARALKDTSQLILI